MILEAKAASCFSATFVLKLDGRAIGRVEERFLSESLDIRLTGRRRLQFASEGWLSSQFWLTEESQDRPIGGGCRSGIFVRGWSLELSSGRMELEPVGWMTSAYECRRRGRALAEVDRLGMCERGWRIESRDGLTPDDLLVIGLVYHVIQRRQAQQNQASMQASGS